MASRRPVGESYLLSVVIPVYNEEGSLRTLLERVHAAPFRKEVIAVDDGSSDGSRDLLRDLSGNSGLVDKRPLHDQTRGTGTAPHPGRAAEPRQRRGSGMFNAFTAEPIKADDSRWSHVA